MRLLGARPTTLLCLLPCLLLCLLLCLAGTLPAQTAAYRITGKVVDAHTGAALSRCSVQIDDTKNRTASRTVLSADDGQFAFENVALGKYSLTAARRGYLTQSFEEHDQYSTAIAVGPGLVSENLIFHLTPQAVLAGAITDDAGEPVRNAMVRLFEDQDNEGVRRTSLHESTMTDDRGRYEIAGLHPGAYFLVVTGHPWYAQHPSPNPSDPAGNRGGESPQSDLDVAYPPTFYPGVTDQDSAIPIPVKGGEHLDASLVLAPEHAVRIRLAIPSGDARHGASVTLSQSLFGQMETQPVVEIQMASEGVMELEGVLPGHYDVAMSKFPQAGGGRPETVHFDADIASGSTELSADAGSGEVSITGKVSVPGAKLPPGGGIYLRASHSRQQYFGQINDAGEFTIEAPPGAYEVLGNLRQMYLARIVADGAPLAGRTLQVKAGSTPRLDITAGSGFAQIDGTALRDGKPASGVMVLLAPEDPRNNEVLFRRDQSDSDGTFSILNVLPGRYRLLAIDKGWELEWANARVLEAFKGKSTPVQVRANDRLKQTIDVQSR